MIPPRGKPYYAMIPEIIYWRSCAHHRRDRDRQPAVITGAFSVTQQAVQLGLLPRIDIRRTSETSPARSTCRSSTTS